MLKRLVFLSVLALFVLAWGLPVMADELAADQAENIVPSAGAKTPGDILWHCDVQTIPDDNHIVGIETFRDTIYITGGASGTDPNKVHVWTRSGSTCNYQYTVDQVSSPGWGWRDIGCDGEYLYASDSRTLQCFYVTPTGVVTVPTNDITITGMDDIGVIRAVAYDPNNDWFWTANFSSNIYAFDRNGDMVSGPHANTYPVYGMAFDATTAQGGPWLWVHSQDGKVYQFDVTPGLEGYTGVAYDAYPGVAGGLCVLEGDPSKDKGSVTLLGITQSEPDEMYAMEISEYGLYWKPGYENYAPSGMPDIDMWQGYGWFKTETGRPTFDGPCAVANCFKWFDSKYEEGFGGVPGDGLDQFPLVRDYMDGIPPVTMGPDDHDPVNVDEGWWAGPMTPWMQGATTLPPATLQPFIPGPQVPGGGLPPWGELVERLAWYLDLDGVQSGYCNHSGVRPQEMYQGIQDWLDSETFEDGSTLADTLCVNIHQMPTFELVEGLVEKCEDVILLLGFWFTDHQFIRGEYLEDGIVDINDWVYCISAMSSDCDDASDANDDGIVDSYDCDYLLNYCTSGGPPPPAPFPACGVDPTPDMLGCASFPLCPGGGEWYRVGGHWVTVAGINSEDFLIGISDPVTDNAEWGGRGRVGDGGILPHDHGEFDHFTHNDEGNVSHDIYDVIVDPMSPGGLWELADYGAPSVSPTFLCDRFFNVNVPPEFEPMTMPYDTTRTLVTEVEYAIQISPWDYRGDVQPIGGDGVVDLGDLLFIINYLYKGGPEPDPYSEGDADCSGIIDLGDVLTLINYLYKGGPVPRCCDP